MHFVPFSSKLNTHHVVFLPQQDGLMYRVPADSPIGSCVCHSKPISNMEELQKLSGCQSAMFHISMAIDNTPIADVCTQECMQLYRFKAFLRKYRLVELE